MYYRPHFIYLSYTYQTAGNVLFSPVYKKGKPKLCKYGFPYKLQDRDCLSDSGMRYNYARLEREDARIVSYNKELLKAWDGHINVQRVTQLGLVRYLVKYVSKVEPTFTTRVKESAEERIAACHLSFSRSISYSDRPIVCSNCTNVISAVDMLALSMECRFTQEGHLDFA